MPSQAIASSSPTSPRSGRRNGTSSCPCLSLGDVPPDSLRDIADGQGFRGYWYVPEDYVERYRDRLDALFSMEEQGEFEDYVYLAEDLASLKGNRFVRKRNLIHQFQREFMNNGVRVHVEPITAGERSGVSCLSRGMVRAAGLRHRWGYRPCLRAQGRDHFTGEPRGPRS